jgi:hypothetical protein
MIINRWLTWLIIGLLTLVSCGQESPKTESNSMKTCLPL